MEIRVQIDESFLRRMHDAAADALEDITEDALRLSRQVVPIEEGTLQRSGFAEVDRKELVGQVGYDTPYAIRQHEDPTLKHDAGRQDHYLSDPAEANRARHLAYLQQKVNEATR